MVWNAEIENNRETLKRIVAILFALAGLAARVSVLPRPLRHTVLWILRPAEVVARQFVIDATCRLAVPWSAVLQSNAKRSALIGVDEDCDGPADAKHLARRFCALALALESLLSRRFACRPGDTAGAQGRHLARSIRELAENLAFGMAHYALEAPRRDSS